MAPLQQPRKQFLDLPNEVLIQIFDSLPSLPEYRISVDNLRQTCRRVLALCEPVFMRFLELRTSSASRKLAFLLQADHQRQDHVQFLVIRPSPSYNDANVALILQHIPSFRYLKSLTVFAPLCEPGEEPAENYEAFIRTLHSQLHSQTFSELQDCWINVACGSLEFFDPPIPPFQISKILRYPKLKSLYLMGMELESQVETIGRGSSAVKTLHVEECETDDQTMSTLLDAPEALEHVVFDIDSLPINSFDGSIELQAVQSLLSNMRRHPVETMKLISWTRERFQIDDFKNSFDFRGLTKLKKLSLRLNVVLYGDSLDPSSKVLNVFEHLPDSLEVLECIKVTPKDVQGLTNMLLLRPIGSRLPVSFRRLQLEGYRDFPQRPFTRLQQQENDELLHSIDVLMAQIGLPELNYILVGPFDVARRIKARRVCNEHCTANADSTRSYELAEEVTGPPVGYRWTGVPEYDWNYSEGTVGTMEFF
ncbi:hypothetical protein H2200_004598 [Cladophialophora chaetospira]|uniref:F-box domain-containing protein n=1 Tax=Cladophialophora chaetospira TaxID=386627 RepID=A0AA38XE29_9EURO|nr:hypothetical protein H2200_004598 [Cladophialophora chaetospira]